MNLLCGTQYHINNKFIIYNVRSKSGDWRDDFHQQINQNYNYYDDKSFGNNAGRAFVYSSRWTLNQLYTELQGRKEHFEFIFIVETEMFSV